MKGGVYDNEEIFGYNAYLINGSLLSTDNRMPEERGGPKAYRSACTGSCTGSCSFTRGFTYAGSNAWQIIVLVNFN
jgi:hypothetical protein